MNIARPDSRRGRHTCPLPGGQLQRVTRDPRYARHAGRNIHEFDGRVVEQPVEMAAS
jgi:hypothetical protein